MNNVNVFDCLRNVAVVARKCPTPVLQTAYVTAVRDWCAQTRWLITTVPGMTTIGEQLYSLGAEPLLEIIGIKAMSITFSPSPSGPEQTLPVHVGDPESWNPNHQPSMPRAYAYVPEGQFSLFPVPDKVYTLTATVQISPTENAREVPAILMPKWSSVFEAGALSQLLAVPGEPWTNEREADRYGRIFSSGVSNGKADTQRSYNTGAQRVRPRPFIY